MDVAFRKTFGVHTAVGVEVGVFVRVAVGLFVGVDVGVFVGVFAGVFVGVTAGVFVGVAVAVCDEHGAPLYRTSAKSGISDPSRLTPAATILPSVWIATDVA